MFGHSLLLLALSTVAVTSAAAQSGVPGPKEYALGELEIRHVAACAMSVDPGKIRTLLKMPPASEAEDRVLAVLHQRLDDCVRLRAGWIGWDTQSLRGAFAAEIYRHDYPVDPDFSGGGLTVLPAAWTEVASKALGYGDADAAKIVRHELALQDFADCVTDIDANDVVLLVRSDPDSAQQTQAVHALMPHLGPCFPSGVTFRATPTSLRAYLAESLLRKAQALGPAKPMVSVLPVAAK